MGYLFKEALKALCGVNQWSYAVFWKIGSQNPKLLIWEECYYGSSPSVAKSSSVGKEGISMQNQEGYGGQLDNKVQLLMDRMMMSNHVNVVGQGLVGRAAFTGNHQWIVSGTYNELAHPTEVLSEIRLQFSAGMQTIAVIPVIPHGVVLLGSPLIMMENVGFVHDVRSFILQLGCIPSAFVSDSYDSKDAASLLGLPVADVTANPISLHGNPILMNSSDRATGSFHLQRNSSDIYRAVSQSSDCLLTQFQDNLQVSGSTFMMPNMTQEFCKVKGGHDAASISTMLNSNVHPSSLVANNVTQGVIMPLKSGSVINQPASNDPGSGISCPQSSTSWHPKLLEQLLVSHDSPIEEKYSTSTSVFNLNEGRCASKKSNSLSTKSGLSVGLKGGHGHSFQTSACANMDKSSSTSNLTGVHNHGNYTKDSAITAQYIHGNQQDNNLCIGSQVLPPKNSVPEDMLVQSTAGDDLFDVLGLDLKNKLLNSNSNDISNSINQQILGSEVYSDYGGISESGIFSSSGSDHLLDAVISGVASGTRKISGDDASCKTSVSCSSVPSAPCSNSTLFGLFNMSDRVQDQILGITKPVVRLVEPVGTSVRSACGKNDDGSCTYGSQISSWIEQGPSTSVSTANSKKSDGGKSNRKRFKPGENPRPRPKDRQMIQDRVKELRDIVPNGAKCSIDALLERTIKHMLFLQSVTKHADKLKQTVGSKIANKESGMLKDDFQGSATWAFELGSQSLVCPIVVEDLNSPRQLLIEMLCEERGFFLEIADIVRGLGLTILKGVMEARNDKIWACFAVEANRDVTRMEVFISLVHLLEQTLKSSTASVNGTNDENMAVLSASMPDNQQLVNPIVCGEPSMI